MEGCPLLTHHGLRAVAEASVDAGRPLLAALRVLNLSQSAGGCRSLACRAVWLSLGGLGPHVEWTPGARLGCSVAERPANPVASLAMPPAGARSDFVLFIERLQYR